MDPTSPPSCLCLLLQDLLALLCNKKQFQVLSIEIKINVTYTAGTFSSFWGLLTVYSYTISTNSVAHTVYTLHSYVSPT